MRYFALSLLLFIGAAGLVVPPVSASATCNDPEWQAVLRHGETAGQAGQKQLQQFAARQQDGPAKRLAQHILATRESPERQRATVEPHPLTALGFQPKSKAGITVAGTAAFQVSVDRNGCVTNVAVSRRHPDSDITDQAKEFVANAMFVPAMKDGIYVSGQTTVIIRIEVR